MTQCDQPPRRVTPDMLSTVATLGAGTRSVVAVPRDQCGWPVHLLDAQHIPYALVALQLPGLFVAADGSDASNLWDNRPGPGDALPDWMAEQLSWWQGVPPNEVDGFNVQLLQTPIPTEYWVSLLASMVRVPFSDQYVAWLERREALDGYYVQEPGLHDVPLGELSLVRDAEQCWAAHHAGLVIPRVA